MKSLTKEIKKLKAKDIAPRFTLWLRIEDTLQKRRNIFWQWRKGLALAAAAVCAVAVFTGHDYYNQYQLERYLSQLFVYTPNPIASEYGTFI
jgi:hypothetical protein